MYCPQCATVNGSDVKYCRSCGVPLEAVALAIAGKSTNSADSRKKKKQLTEEEWLEKHVTGVANLTRGAILFAVSLLLAVPLAIFGPRGDPPWIILWIGLFGWLAVWGGIAMASAIGDVLEAKSRLRLLALTGKRPLAGSTTQDLLPAREWVTPNDAAVTPRSPVSVTEGTTRHLDD